jgi:hypothetical protein
LPWLPTDVFLTVKTTYAVLRESRSGEMLPIHRAGIEGLAADPATGIGPGAAARRIEGLAADRRIKSGEPARLAPQPVVGRIRIDEGACGWQVYPW